MLRPALRSPTRRPSRSRLRIEALEDRRQPSLTPAGTYAVGTAPQAVVTADFNGDNLPDLVTANYSASTVSVLLGNADGTFQPAVHSPTSSYPQSVAVGDFDADGKMDLATANVWDVSVLRGNGDGTFQAPANTYVGSDPQSVAVGDFNADGKMDLGVTGNWYTPGSWGYWGWYPGWYNGVATVLIGTGTGSFAAPASTSLGYGFHRGAAVADFNADGRADFAAGAPDSGSVAVLLADATGLLQGPTYFAAGVSPGALAAGDVSGDGKADLVAGGQYGETVGVLLGNGTGGFGAPQAYAAGGIPQAVALGDFNGDSNPDIAAAVAGGPSVLLGRGNGTFLPPLPSGAGSYPVGLAVGDFNGDGRRDAATVDPGANAAAVYRNDGVWPALDAPSLTVTDVTVTEGHTGTTNATFTVRLSAAYNQTVTVRYATQDSGAVAGADYQSTSGTLTFAPGDTEETVPVPVIGDRAGEYNESFFLRLSEPTNAFVADGTGVGTITDDEPWVSISGFSGPEGHTGTSNFNFTVTLSGAYDVPVTVAYATADLTPDEEWSYGPAATAGVDYEAKTGTVTFEPGQTSQTIPISVIGDRVGEYSELFWVNLSNPSAGGISGGQALGTIEDDEPYLSITGGTVTEGHSGTKDLTFTVTLSAPYDEPVTATFATADGSAKAGADYEAKTRTVTIAPGTTTETVTVSVLGDRLGEPDEYFAATLSGVTGARVGWDTAYGNIRDDEPRLTVNSVSVREGHRGTTLMTFTVTLSAAYDQAVTVNYATQDGSAKAGEDYVATSGTLTFAAGQTTRTFTVAIKGDKKKESNESFYVRLSEPSSNAMIGYEYGWGTILNDDGPRR